MAITKCDVKRRPMKPKVLIEDIKKFGRAIQCVRSIAERLRDFSAPLLNFFRCLRVFRRIYLGERSIGIHQKYLTEYTMSQVIHRLSLHFVL
jgi:hypothetical protein